MAMSVLAVAASAGCVREWSVPPVGTADALCHIVTEEESGPIVLVVLGRGGECNDRLLGTRQIALETAKNVKGSTAIFSWQTAEDACEWVRREALKRRRRGETARLGLIGHSWGGDVSSRMATRFMREDTVDEITLYVTLDAITQGFVKCGAETALSMLLLEGVLPHRLPLMAFRNTPAPDGKKLKRHINYYQVDSTHLHGYHIPTATENHEVWFDRGHEIGHGNMDNFIIPLVVEDMRRALGGGGQ